MTDRTVVLVVEDEEAIRELVATYLEQEGFAVLAAPDGTSMRRTLAESSVDLIVLDVRLPDEDGFDLVRELRRTRDTPVILLTGKAAPVDRIVGLELGADDYLAKPFELRELLARIRSVLRRTLSSDAQAAPGSAPGSAPGPGGIKVRVFSGWALDPVRRRLFSPDGAEVELTGAEFELLRELVENAQQPISRNQLLNAAQSRDWEPHDRSIDVSISRLRKKLESDPGNPTLIKTIRNVGYILASEVTDQTLKETR